MAWTTSAHGKLESSTWEAASPMQPRRSAPPCGPRLFQVTKSGYCWSIGKAAGGTAPWVKCDDRTSKQWMQCSSDAMGAGFFSVRFALGWPGWGGVW
eukprot:3746803-Prymnesium_polylepis.1